MRCIAAGPFSRGRDGCPQAAEHCPAGCRLFRAKDFQQTRVLEQMVADLNVPTRLVVCPTLREPDGLAAELAKSISRPDPAPASAQCCFRHWRMWRSMISKGERRAGPLIEAIRTGIGKAPSRAVDYAAIVDANTLSACGSS